MKDKEDKTNIGLHIIFITLLVALAALVSEYRVWILLASPAIFTIWLLWLWSKRLENMNKRIKSLEEERESEEKLLKTIKDITNIINNLKIK